MRILLACDPLLPVPPVHYGGIERIVASLVREYRARGHMVGLVAKRGSTCAADAAAAWPDERITGPVATLRNALALARAARRFRADVVHSFARLAYLLPLLPSPRPKIMSYQRQTGPRPAAQALRWARGGTLRFTGCSEFICAQGRPGGGEWTAIPNFADVDRIAFAPAVAPDAPLVFLSRIESIKGPDHAIAIARAAGRPLLLAGNRAAHGPEAEFWRTRIEPELTRGGVEYVGEVDDTAKAALLRRAAALLVPIQWDEPFGIVFAEALAAGTPVITCARGAAPEIIEPGRTGFFVRGVDDGVAAVRRLGELDRAACRAAAVERFSAGVVAERYLELYRAATGAAPGASVHA